MEMAIVESSSWQNLTLQGSTFAIDTIDFRETEKVHVGAISTRFFKSDVLRRDVLYLALDRSGILGRSGRQGFIRSGIRQQASSMNKPAT